MIKKIINTFLISSLIFLTSCGNDLVTFLDEYNEPYGIKVIPTNGGIIVNYWSGVLASDFAGFNFYVNNNGNFIQPSGALTNQNGILPTYPQSNHSRIFFSFQIPGNYINGSLYYVGVTAYGTNDLASNKYIETKISASYPVMPRPEGNSSFNTASGSQVLVNGVQVAETATDIDTGVIGIKGFQLYKMQYLGYQTNFNGVVIITNTNYTLSFDNGIYPYQNQGMYLLYDGVNILVKLWITSTNTTTANFYWAENNNSSLWFGL